MATVDAWLGKLARLRVDRASGDPAPHKPLLVLAVIDFAERGEIDGETLPLTPELAFQFYTYWSIVAHRRKQRPDVRLPFHYLRSDGCWKVLDEHRAPSNHFRTSKTAILAADFLTLLRDKAARERARRILIATYFRPEERVALYTMLGMRIPSDDEIRRDKNYRPPEEAKRKGREARFRYSIVAAYNYTCSLTGYRLTTIEAGSIVDAAHIHQFADSRNDNPRNGLALCKNAHWQFDQGLWTVSDDYHVITAAGQFAEDCPDGKPLGAYHGSKLRLPRDERLWPDPKHFAWHRKRCFVGET